MWYSILLLSNWTWKNYLQGGYHDSPGQRFAIAEKTQKPISQNFLPLTKLGYIIKFWNTGGVALEDFPNCVKQLKEKSYSSLTGWFCRSTQYIQRTLRRLPRTMPSKIPIAICLSQGSAHVHSTITTWPIFTTIRIEPMWFRASILLHMEGTCWLKE